MAMELISVSVSPPSFASFDSRAGSSIFTSSTSHLHMFPRTVTIQGSCSKKGFLTKRGISSAMSRKRLSMVCRSSGPSSPESSPDDPKPSEQAKVPFGYSRKDVLLIGVGVGVFGFGLKSGLEFVGVDPLQAGNVVQLVLVLGLIVGWISTYVFRVSNKEMTYVQQLRDYEDKVMEKRLQGLTEAELEVLLAQVEEEKRLGSGEKIN